MRAFVALDVPGQVLDSLVSFGSELSATGADLKLVERQNLHFTLKFLGEITDGEAAEAQSKLSGLQMKGATAEVRGVGAFPNARSPRVVWAGVAREQEAPLVQIAKEVIAVLEGIGERDDRPFQAHITLGRVRSFRNSGALGDLLRENAGRSFGTAVLSEVKLKSSVLTPAGPIYKDIGAFPLK